MNDMLSCLPHDKIRVHYGSKGDSFSQFEQCIIAQSGTNSYQEFFLYALIYCMTHSPVSDPLIRRYVQFLLDSGYSMFTLAQHQNATIDAYNKQSALGRSRADRFKHYNANEAFIPTVLLETLDKVLKLTTNCHMVFSGEMREMGCKAQISTTFLLAPRTI